MQTITQIGENAENCFLGLARTSVFASNATLTFRCNGISDRTIRRHAATLQELGLLVRHDSPNRKRFTKHNTHAGKALRFGFDLSPLFDRLHEIAALAVEALKEKEQLDYLRAKIRAAANESLCKDPEDERANNILRILRRKLSLQDCEQILSNLNIKCIKAEANDDEASNSTTTMTGNDGHFVRQHHKSNKENIDKKEKTQMVEPKRQDTNTEITIPELLSACPEAAQYSLNRIETANDVVAHARTLAPMIGITSQSYEAAHDKLGPFRTAITVWAIIQCHDKIKTVGAYFRSITTGSKCEGFRPEKLVRRLIAQNCEI